MTECTVKQENIFEHEPIVKEEEKELNQNFIRNFIPSLLPTKQKLLVTNAKAQNDLFGFHHPLILKTKIFIENLVKKDFRDVFFN